MGTDPWLTNGWQLLKEVSLQSVFLAACLCLLLWLVRVRHPASQHRAWLGLTVGMLVWPLVALGVPSLEIPWGSAPQGDVLEVASAALTSEVPGTYSGAHSEVPGTYSGALSRTLSEVPGTNSDSLSEVPGTLSWKVGVAWLYGLGVAVLLGRLLLGWLAVGTLRRSSTPIDDAKLRALMTDIIGPQGPSTELRLAPTLDVPACFGWLRPVIFLPNAFLSWDMQKQEAVLAHECHHIRRMDSLSQTLALVNRSLYWFHPLAWWLPKHLAQLAERSCDAGAVRRSANPQLYARYLLEVAALVTPSRRPTLMQSMGGRHDLEVRVRALLDRRTWSRARSPRWAGAWTAALCLVVGGVAASELVPRQAAPILVASAAAPSSEAGGASPAAASLHWPASSHPLADLTEAAESTPAVGGVSPSRVSPSRFSPSGFSPSRVSASGGSPFGVSPSVVTLVAGPRPSFQLAALEIPQRPGSFQHRTQPAEPVAGRQVIVIFDDKNRVSSLRRSWRHRSWDLIVPALNEDLMQWFGASLESQDRVAVLSHHGRELRLHQDLTTQRHRWAEALDEVARWQGPPSVAATDPGGPSLGALLDELRGGRGSSMQQALEDLAAASGRLPGRTSVLLVSSRFAGDQIAMEGGDVNLRPSRFEAGHQRILDAFMRSETPIQLLDPWRVGKRGMWAQPLFPASPSESTKDHSQVQGTSSV